MLECVYLAAKKCPEFSEVYAAVDAEEVAAEVCRFGGKWIMTSPSLPTGTHRLIQFMDRTGIDAEVIVNWQADEPLISREMITDLLQGIMSPHEMIWTLKKKARPEEVLNPNVVKVVTDSAGKALYFSRSPIPFDRDLIGCSYFKHVGLYAYRKKALQLIKGLSESELSKIEKLEQLTFLENGLSITVFETQHESQGIDTQEDLEIINRRPLHMISSFGNEELPRISKV